MWGRRRLLAFGLNRRSLARYDDGLQKHTQTMGLPTLRDDELQEHVRKPVDIKVGGSPGFKMVPRGSQEYPCGPTIFSNFISLARIKKGKGYSRKIELVIHPEIVLS